MVLPVHGHRLVSTATAELLLIHLLRHAGQCATTTTLTITVNPAVTPTFTAIPDICQDAAASSITNYIQQWYYRYMVTGSQHSYSGTTTYTFTPDAGQCATTTTLTITVNPTVTPTFTAVPDICVRMQQLPALPTTSNNGITGTWSPRSVRLLPGTTTYTFTPAAGQCATTTTLTITVNATVTPTFTASP